VANRINHLDGGSVSSGTGGAVQGILPAKPAGSSASGSGSGSPPAPDSVNITASGRALAALSQAVQDAPEVDGARVSSVQQAISSGHYSVNADRIAGRMLQLEQDLGESAQ
jgi:negative regulator of flagellin synthesis FlgM